MPEMPEVETIRRILEPQIRGERILGVNIIQPKVIAYPDAQTFGEMLVGQKMQSMSRRGKFLTIHCESGDRIAVHLRMTGQLLVMPADYPLEPHTHLIALLSGGKQLRYVDVRRFGRLWYGKAGEKDTVTGQVTLGLEPLDNALTGAYLHAKMGTGKKTIKEMLLDQRIVAGIGNIYSDEILFASRMYPATKCFDVHADSWDILAEQIKEVISWGIKTDEMTPEAYLEGRGKAYRNIPQLSVYGREGLPCVHCHSTLERMVIAGRSSCYCPFCQRKTN